ncbi:MAG: hypothetical protein ACFFCO_11600 [Promethearchaeota archaeon]
MAKSDLKKIAEILVLIGAIISLIYGILMILGGIGISFWLPGFGFPLGWFIPGWGLIGGIITLILALITMATCGVINFPLKMEKNWVMLLILGILLAIFGGDWGAFLVILGAILLIFA